MRLASTFRWIATFLAVSVLTPFVEPLIQDYLASGGYYSNPQGWLATAMNWVSILVGDGAAPYVIGGVVGIAVGSWIDSVLRWAYTAKLARLEALGVECLDLARDIKESLDSVSIPASHPRYSNEMHYNDVFWRTRALYEVINKRGFDTPPLAMRGNSIYIGDFLSDAEKFLFSFGAYLQKGQIDSAKTLSVGHKKQLARKYSDDAKSSNQP